MPLHNFSNRHLGISKWIVKFISFFVNNPLVSTDKRMSGMFTCHQRTTRRSTDRTACIMLSETNSIDCQTVNGRSFDYPLSVAPQITYTQIISHDINHIRLLESFGSRNRNIQYRHSCCKSTKQDVFSFFHFLDYYNVNRSIIGSSCASFIFSRILAMISG